MPSAATVSQRRAASKRRCEHHAGAGVERRQRQDLEAEGMEQGHRDEHAVGGARFEEELGVQAVEERLAVREQRALRRAGGARGVHEEHRVLGRDGLDGRARRAARELRLVGVGRAADGEAHERARSRALPGGARRRLELRLVAEHPGRAVVEELAKLGGREARVQRDGDGAEPRRREAPARGTPCGCRAGAPRGRPARRPGRQASLRRARSAPRGRRSRGAAPRRRAPGGRRRSRRAGRSSRRRCGARTPWVRELPGGPPRSPACTMAASGLHPGQEDPP